MRADAYQFRVFPGVPASLMARVRGPDGAFLNRDAVATVVYKVFEGETQTESGTLDKTQVIFDTLQAADTRWDRDKTGYNFRWDIPGAFISNAHTEYTVQITITAAVGGQSIKLSYEPNTTKWLG